MNLLTLPRSSQKSLPIAGWARANGPSAIQEMLPLMSQPDIISLALGLPAQETLPARALQAAFGAVLEREGWALQYAQPSLELRQQVTTLMRQRQVTCSAAQVFITAGAQQGMSLLCRLLLGPGSSVIVEERAYPGFLQALQPHAPSILPVASSATTGIDVEAVERLLEGGARPSLIYVISDGHNPLGVSLSLQQRRTLAELARSYRVVIVEDDPYGLLNYDSAPLPPIRAFEPEWVCYVGSFSKILAPALRTGWLVVPEELMEPLSNLKEASDINTSNLAQRAISQYLATHDIAEHLRRSCAEYESRRDVLLQALAAELPEGARWNTPTAGMFVWLELAGAVDTTQLLQRALRDEGVAFLPDAAFRAHGDVPARPGLRLNFSSCAPSLLREGVRRLARVVRKTTR